MAIRLVHQPVGIGGLAAYAGAWGRRQPKYPLPGALGPGRRGPAVGNPQLGGQWINPLMVRDEAGAVPGGDPQQRVQQNAQIRAFQRSGKYGNLLPQFIPQAQIERQQKLADQRHKEMVIQERDRLIHERGMERVEAAHQHALERADAGNARADMKERRRQAELAVAGLEIPEWATPEWRDLLERQKSQAKEFLRPDIDLGEPEMGNEFSSVLDTFNMLRGMMRQPNPTEAEQADTYFRNRRGVVVDESDPEGIAFSHKSGKAIDLPEDPAAKLAEEDRKELLRRYRSEVGTTDEDTGVKVTPKMAQQRAQRGLAEEKQMIPPGRVPYQFGVDELFQQPEPAPAPSSPVDHLADKLQNAGAPASLVDQVRNRFAITPSDVERLTEIANQGGFLTKELRAALGEIFSQPAAPPTVPAAPVAPPAATPGILTPEKRAKYEQELFGGSPAPAQAAPVAPPATPPAPLRAETYAPKGISGLEQFRRPSAAPVQAAPVTPKAPAAATTQALPVIPPAVPKPAIDSEAELRSRSFPDVPQGQLQQQLQQLAQQASIPRADLDPEKRIKSAIDTYIPKSREEAAPGQVYIDSDGKPRRKAYPPETGSGYSGRQFYNPLTVK